MNTTRLDDCPPHRDTSGKIVHVRPEDLREGDILLSYGQPKPLGVSWWIRFVDDTCYSHTSYFDGEMVVDSTREGVTRVPVADRVHGQHYLDVFRFVSDDGDPMGSDGWPPDPVSAAVERYRDHAFPMYDLVFLAGIVSFRRVDLPDFLEWKIRWILSKAILKLRQVIFHEERIHLTCVELIYRGFREANPTPRYRLTVPLRNPDTGAPGEEDQGVESNGPGRVLLDAIPMHSVEEWNDANRHALRELARLPLDHLEADGLDDLDVAGVLSEMSDEEIEEQDVPEMEALRKEFALLYSAHKGGLLRPADSDQPPAPVSDFVSIFDVERSPNLEILGRAWPEDYPRS